MNRFGYWVAGWQEQALPLLVTRRLMNGTYRTTAVVQLVRMSNVCQMAIACESQSAQNGSRPRKVGLRGMVMVRPSNRDSTLFNLRRCGEVIFEFVDILYSSYM